MFEHSLFQLKKEITLKVLKKEINYVDVIEISVKKDVDK